MVAAALLIVAGASGAPAFADPSPQPTPPSSPAGSGGQNSAGQITWSVQPSTQNGPDQRPSFTYTDIAPGTVIHDYVGVTNFSQNAVAFDIYATDAFNNTSGTLDLLASAQKPKDVGSWLDLAKTNVTIQPGQRVNEPFTLTVPFNATPGDHVGGVVAAVSATQNAGQGVQVDTRLAAAIYLRVSGQLTSGVAVESVSANYHATFNPFGGGATDVSYTIHNTGNTRLNLASVVKVTGLFGAGGSATPPLIKDLLPGATVRLTQRVGSVFPLGPMTAHVDATPSIPVGLPAPVKPLENASGQAGIWATPWGVLLILVIIAALVAGALMYLRRGRERTQGKVAKAVAKARKETIEELTKN
jgi:hypothetical protein